MAINVSQAFKRTSIAPIDETLALTKAQMVSTVDTLMPAYYFTICQDDGKIYLYDKTATPSVTTGKFTEFSGGGGGGSSDVKFFTTTDTLSKDINGTKVVAAADLPGVTWSDLVVGSSVIKDAKGTMGLVTTITGTTSVTVTTATTSTPTVELTQAQYDALATKDPDTIYFITDSYVPGTYMGAYDSIYSTTEHVVGSYMGKPLYQKTIETTLPTTATTGTVASKNVATGTANIESVVDTAAFFMYGGIWHSVFDRDITTSPYGAVKVLVVDGSSTLSTPNTLLVQNSQALWSGATIVVTVRYTKTTDVASPVEYANVNDYSTSEKIVGTWIDGRPLYQKTFTGFSLANATGLDLSTIGVASNWTLINFEGSLHVDGTANGRLYFQTYHPQTGTLYIQKNAAGNWIIVNTMPFVLNDGVLTVKYVKPTS